MDIAVSVISVILSVITGYYAYTLDLDDFERLNKRRTCAKLFVWAFIIYGGYVAALGTSSWVLGTGAAPALSPIVVLLVCYFVQRHKLNKLGEYYANLCPLSTLTETTTFEQALSVSCRLISLTIIDCVSPQSTNSSILSFAAVPGCHAKGL
jgi:hypothetical protein